MKLAAAQLIFAATLASPGTSLASATTTTKKHRRNKINQGAARRAQVTSSCLGPTFETSYSGSSSCNYADISSALTTKIQNECTGEGVVVADEVAFLIGSEAEVEAKCNEALAAAENDPHVFLPFGDVTRMGDMFDKEFLDGGAWWNERVQDETGQYVLSADASRLLESHNLASAMGVAWSTSDAITNLANCDTGAVSCCFVSDRQADELGGTCKGPMCTEAEPDDNTDVCYVDMSRSPTSARVPTGVAVYDRDTEGSARCEGFAWNVNDPDSVGSRYRGNALVQVLKTNFYDKGYVYNVPGAPMCGCVEQMPVVSKAACTQVSAVQESWTISSQDGGESVTLALSSVDSVTYDDTCGGTNDLKAHIEATIDPNSNIASYLVGEGGCQGAIDAHLANHGLKRSTLEIVGIKGHPDGTHVSITYSGEVADSAADVDNYLIAGLDIAGATLDEEYRTVTLTTSSHSEGGSSTYVLEVVGTGVVKRVASVVSVPVGTTATFDVASYGYAANVPESANYTLLYTLDIPDNANWQNNVPPYVLGTDLVVSFSRVAYFMELESEDYHHQWMWVSMDAFTQNSRLIAVPTFSSGAVFQETANNVNVVTNDYGTVAGGTLTGVEGNIEFWPHNYSPQNANSVDGASDTLYDFGDTRSTSGNYGSMQVHVASIDTTLFAMNNWNRNRDGIDVGIGNAPNPRFRNPDWTFAAKDATNANDPLTYTLKSLQVLVLSDGEGIDPANLVPSDTITAAVAEASDGYELVYDLDIPNNANYESGAVPYQTDYSLFRGTFERVAYYVELESAEYGSQWVWVSMDAFTDEAGKVGVPTFSSGAIFQQEVTGLNVVSNVGGMNGTNMTGNLEFWPNNYGTSNTNAVPGASGSLFDFGDQRSTGGNYGSMQVHAPSLPANARTIFAYNDWNRNVNPCLGIGENTVGDPDWTFTNNGLIYTTKKMQIFIK